MAYDPRDDAARSYDDAIDAMRERVEALKASGAKQVRFIGDALMIQGDCLEVMPALGRVDAIISDPPYGIAFTHGGNDNSGIGGGKYATRFAGKPILGDETPFDPTPLLSLADELVLWGANHYADKLPPSPSWYVWDKRAASGHTNDFADCELAWVRRKGVARMFRHHWDGMMKASERGQARVHPTQKPIALMLWCIEQTQGKTILDPFMGAGSTGIAACQAGRKFIGIELDPDYFEIACKRVEEAWKQPRLFDEPKPAKPVTGNLFDGDAA